MKSARSARWLLLSVLAVFTVLPCAAQKRQAGKLENLPPLIDFTEFKQDAGKLTDKTGNAILETGKSFRVGDGPFGGKSWEFDGRKTSVSTLDYSKLIKRFDGFDYSVAFWFRCDEIQAFRLDPKLSGNTLGLGLDMNGNGVSAMFRLRGTGGDVAAWFGINPKRWNHIAVIHSVDKHVTKVYVNGFPVVDRAPSELFYPVNTIPGGKQQLGMFKGAIADVKIWNEAVSPNQFLNMDITKRDYEECKGQIDEVLTQTARADGARIMCKTLTDELDAIYAKKNVPIVQFNAFLKRLNTVQRLIPAVNALKKTALSEAPYALMQIQAISPDIRTPLTYPENPVYTDELTAIAAKNEYTSISFMIFPYRNVGGFTFELEDMKGDHGGSIPAAEIELKFVQCWMQPGWNTYFNGHGNYVPALLMNDPTLLKIDEEKKINYLRLNYPDGVKYANICIPGSVLKEAPFQWAFEPAYDADTLQPVPIEFGRNRQFWIDLHVPKTAKAGLYRGKLKILADGKPAGSVTLVCKVLPFELPEARTQFDLNRPYMASLATGYTFADTLTVVKDAEKAKELVRKHAVNLYKHNIWDPIIGGLGGDLSNENAFKINVEIFNQAGVFTKHYGMGGNYEWPNMAGVEIPFDKLATKEFVKEQFDIFYKRIDKTMELIDKYVGGRRDTAFFYGMDEAQDIFSFRLMSGFRDYIFRKGGRIATTGWEDNYRVMPSHEDFHTSAAMIDRRNSARWHAIRGYITCYCGPFIGPDNPDLMRRSHGLKMYRANLDGWWELAYSSGNYHTWNHLFGYDTTYRPFRFVIDTNRGPLINTIAFCGMREGMDDIRYATLLHLLAKECLDSGETDKIVAARQSLVWFRSQPYPGPANLDNMRAGMIHHILSLMKILGKPMI